MRPDEEELSTDGDEASAEYPLAWNGEGEAFDVPPRVAAWRVRRMPPGRGRPDVIYGEDGRPLRLPVTASIDDLADAVGAGGRYRLDGVDEDGFSVASCPTAFVRLPDERPAEPEAAPPAALISALVDQTRAQNNTITQLSNALVARDEHVAKFIAALVQVVERLPEPAPAPVVIPEPSAPAFPAPSNPEPEAERSMLDKLLESVGPDVVRALLPTVLSKLGPAAAPPQLSPAPSAPATPEGGAA